MTFDHACLSSFGDKVPNQALEVALSLGSQDTTKIQQTTWYILIDSKHWS